MLEWRRNHQFCSHCGHQTIQHATQYAMVCFACGYNQYPRVNPCVITIITVAADEIPQVKMPEIKHKCTVLLLAFVEVGETLKK